jgi:spermidine synthase
MSTPGPVSRARTVALLTATFLTGLVVMALELVAFRLYAPHFGYSEDVWGAMIGVVLVALTLGYALGGRLADRSEDEAPLLYAIGASALYQVGILGVVLRFLAWCATLDPRLGPFVATLVIFTTPMTLLAMTGPFVTRLLARGDHVGSVAGNVSAISTVGSIVGVFGTSFFFVPTFGVRATLVLCAVVSALVSLVGLALARRFKAAPAALVPLVLLPLLPGFDWGENTIWIRESEYNLVRVFERGGQRFLSLNDERTAQTIMPIDGGLGGRYFDLFMFGPALAHGDRTLVLGMGAGASVWATRMAAPHAEIDAVEIDPEVVYAARHFFELPTDDRMHVHVADARAYLREAEGPYDVVHVDLYQGGMYQPFYLVTEETFARVRSLLRDDGVMVMNVYDGASAQQLLAAVARTIHTSFPSLYVIDAGRRNHVVFAFPRETSLADIEARLSRDMEAEGMPHAAADFTSKERGDFEPIEIDARAPIFTDDLAPVEVLTRHMVDDMRRETAPPPGGARPRG